MYTSDSEPPEVMIILRKQNYDDFHLNIFNIRDPTFENN